MPPSTDIIRARIEQQTALVQYKSAKLEFARSICAIVVAAIGLATMVVGAVTAIVLALAT